MINRIITTSWDDGHPLDIRIAELMDKYRIAGTFYIPKHNPQNTVMGDEQLIAISKKFEIGGHTLNHINLKQLKHSNQVNEIAGCYNWQHQLTGKIPQSFCPPFGAYNKSTLAVIFKTGFKVVRSTQLLSFNKPGAVNPTTLQMFNHSGFTYAKHLLIRGRFSDFIWWLKSGSTADLLKLTDFYLEQIDRSGGCFHLWGHSWEIEQFGLWKELEIILKHLSQRPSFRYIENGQLSEIPLISELS